MQLSELEREAKVILFVLGAMHSLAERGLVEMGSRQLSDEGKATYEQLRAEGFRPTADEIQDAIAFLNNEDGDDET